MSKRRTGKDVAGQTWFDWRGTPAAPIEPVSPPEQVPEPSHPSQPPKSYRSKVATRKQVVRMPIPEPLPKATAAGHFGVDEEGKLVHPSPEKVREITDTQVCKLIDCMLGLQDVEKDDVVNRARLQAEYQQVLRKYAESFGQEASCRLDIFAKQQAILDVRTVNLSTRVR